MNIQVDAALCSALEKAVLESTLPNPWWEVYAGVYEAGNWAVDRAVSRTVAETTLADPNHIALQDFLHELEDWRKC